MPDLFEDPHIFTEPKIMPRFLNSEGTRSRFCYKRLCISFLHVC